jgi:hypothetical protein
MNAYLNQAGVTRAIASIARKGADIKATVDSVALSIVHHPADLAGKAPALLNAIADHKAMTKAVAEFFADHLANVLFVRDGKFQLGKVRKDAALLTVRDDDTLTPSTYQSEASKVASEARKAKATATKEANTKTRERQEAADKAEYAELRNARLDLQLQVELLQARVAELEAMLATAIAEGVRKVA